MKKDKERFNRSSKQTLLSHQDAQTILADIYTSEIEKLEYLEGGFSNTNYLVRFKANIAPVVIRIGNLTSRQFDIEASISEKFKNIKVLFDKENLEETLGEILSKSNKTQLRIAETEKYATAQGVVVY